MMMILYYVACDASTVVVDEVTRVYRRFVTPQESTTPTIPMTDDRCVDKKITHNILTHQRQRAGTTRIDVDRGTGGRGGRRGRGAHTTTHPPDARGATHMAYESHHM